MLLASSACVGCLHHTGIPFFLTCITIVKLCGGNCCARCKKNPIKWHLQSNKAFELRAVLLSNLCQTHVKIAQQHLLKHHREIFARTMPLPETSPIAASILTGCTTLQETFDLFKKLSEVGEHALQELKVVLWTALILVEHAHTEAREYLVGAAVARMLA